MLDFCREATGVIDRAIDFGFSNAERRIDRLKLLPILLADDEVVVAMAGRGMHTAGAGFARAFLLRVGDIQFGFGVGLAAERDVLADYQD